MRPAESRRYSQKRDRETGLRGVVGPVSAGAVLMLFAAAARWSNLFAAGLGWRGSSGCGYGGSDKKSYTRGSGIPSGRGPLDVYVYVCMT